jgi:phosphoglycerate kinase
MTIEELAERVDLNDQKVLVRVDLNVPLDQDDNVTDDTRLRAVLPTVNYLLSQNAAVILCSHFGRPKGEVIATGKNGRLTAVVAPLQQLLNGEREVKVTKLDDCVGPQVEQFVHNELLGGQVCILENTRFHMGETKNDPALPAGLVLADWPTISSWTPLGRRIAPTPPRSGSRSICSTQPPAF